MTRDPPDPPDPPDPQAQLQAVSARLGLALRDPYPDVDALRDVVDHFPELVPALVDAGPVLERKDSQHSLWVYEHTQDATAVHTKHNRHDVEIRRLAVLLKVPGMALAERTIDARGRTKSGTSLPAEATASMQRWGEFSMATADDILLFIQDQPASALVSAIERGQSPEFQPGLLNSGLAIDIQRALDIANMLLPADRALPPVYKVDVGDPAPKLPKRALDLKLDETVARTHAQLEALREERERQRAARMAERAQQQAPRDDLGARGETGDGVQAAGDRLKDKLAALREEREVKRAARLEQQEATRNAHERRLKALLNPDGGPPNTADGPAPGKKTP